MRIRQGEGQKYGRKIPAPNGTYENFSLLEASAWRNLDKREQHKTPI